MRGYLKGILALVSLGSLVSGGWLMAQNAPVKNVVLVTGPSQMAPVGQRLSLCFKPRASMSRPSERRLLRLQMILQRPACHRC